MRFSCKSCQATFQTASGAPAAAGFRCPSCHGEMAAVAEVVELYQDRIPTRRYDLDDLRARLDLEREEAQRAKSAPRTPDQVWFAAVQGRQVGPLSAAGIAGLRARGQLSAASLVWREGWASWVAAEAVPELRAVLGLPEEKPGRPFPVAPESPVPPPAFATYAAASSEPFAEAARPGDKTQPDARVPEGLLASLDTGALEAGAPARQAEGQPLDGQEVNGKQVDDQVVDDSPRREASRPPPPVISPVPPLPAEPPALPLADARALERATAAVLAEPLSEPPARPPLPPLFDASEEPTPPALPPEQIAAAQAGAAVGPTGAASLPSRPGQRAPGAPGPLADPADKLAAGSPASGGKAPSADPAGDGPPMIELSAAPPDETAPQRRSRGPSQTQWFSEADEPDDSPLRSKLVLGIALALALTVLWLLMRSR